jgi:phage major head subunit gpT-like protein
MQITPAALAATATSFDTRFQAAVGSAVAIWSKIASLIPSTGSSTVHAIMNSIPKARKWLGERVIHNVASAAYELKNETYEDTVAIKREAFEDDSLGVYNPTLDMLGQQAALWPDDLVIAALKAGASTVCHDGQYFFDTDHAKPGGTQSNKLALALTSDNFATVRTAMRSFVGEDGRNLGVNPNLLVVPPALEMTARTILLAEKLANGADNMTRGLADILVVNDLAGSDTTWYLMDTSKPIKPLIFQQRKAPHFDSLTDPTSENVFKHREFLYGFDCRGAGGYGPWFLAAVSTPAG